MAFPLLNISPSQLEFLFEAERELKSTLNLRNVNEGVRVAFKIKTTNSERFVVCPPTGIVEPGTTRLVKIYLKAQRDYDEDLRLCKDRFLVQSIVVDEDADELELTSGMFRTVQRQEAKLKVVVAAPLAHASVLENEIRTIALRQGIEGHRAAVRKFSELLLARGIISQAQVVLAFSTVGEIFQGMQGTLKADRDFDYNNILGPRSSGLSVENGGPETPGASTTFPRRSNGELTTHTPPGGEPFDLRTAALFTAAGRKPGELDTGSSPSAVAGENGKREMLYTAVGRKPAENGVTEAGSEDGKREYLNSAMGSIPEEDNGRLVPTRSTDVVLDGRRAIESGAAPPGTPPPTPADPPAPHSASESASPAGVAPPPRVSEEAIDALFDADSRSRSINTAVVDKTEIAGEEYEKAEVAPRREAHRYSTPKARRPSFTNGTGPASDPDLAFQSDDVSDSRTPKSTRRLLRPRRTIGELKEPRSPESPNQVNEENAGPVEAANEAAVGGTESEITPDTPSGKERAPEPTNSGKANWPQSHDSMGRLNPVTRIDRLATPAYRKTSLPAATQKMNAMIANAQSSARADEELALKLSRVASGFESPNSPSSSNGQEAAEPQAVPNPSERSHSASAISKPAVSIPPGNTLKMANLWGMRRS